MEPARIESNLSLAPPPSYGQHNINSVSLTIDNNFQEPPTYNSIVLNKDFKLPQQVNDDQIIKSKDIKMANTL